MINHSVRPIIDLIGGNCSGEFNPKRSLLPGDLQSLIHLGCNTPVMDAYQEAGKSLWRSMERSFSGVVFKSIIMGLSRHFRDSSRCLEKVITAYI